MPKINTEELKLKLNRKNISQSVLADKAGITRASMNGLLNNKRDPRLSEVQSICKALKLTDKEKLDIFLDE